jgi:hypothetical protein
VLALYADDARVIWADEGAEAYGKAEVEKLLTNAMNRFPKDGRVVFKSQEAVPLGNGYIATVGHWEISFTNDDGKKQTVQIRSTEITGSKDARPFMLSIMRRLGRHGRISLQQPSLFSAMRYWEIKIHIPGKTHCFLFRV